MQNTPMMPADESMPSGPQTRWQRVQARYQELHARYVRYWPAAFFVAGFVFDVATLSRIDDLFTIGQQGVYLAILGLILFLETKESRSPLALGPRARKFWNYRDEVAHFLYGSLLSVYTLFYFKSASLVTSFVFLGAMAGLMIANESERFQKLGVLVRFALYSLCLTSYFCYVIPVALGFIGVIPFLLAVLSACVILTGLHKALGHPLKAAFKRQTQMPMESPALETEDRIAAKRIDHLAPRFSFGIQAAFVLLYVFQLIPPVPLSIQSMGIYHQIEKVDGHYKLSYERPFWKIWESGAQTFLARPGDRIYVFASIFSPAHFKDEVQVRWLYDDDRLGWQSSDAIPIAISGGRDEGFRGFTYKQNFQPGRWRVQLETRDGREIGRIGFKVVPVTDEGPRNFATDIR